MVASKAGEEKSEGFQKGEPAPAKEGPALPPATTVAVQAAPPSGKVKPLDEPKRVEGPAPATDRVSREADGRKPNRRRRARASGSRHRSEAGRAEAAGRRLRAPRRPGASKQRGRRSGPSLCRAAASQLPRQEPTESKPVESNAENRKATPGWIPIPNSGSLPVDPWRRRLVSSTPGQLDGGSRAATAPADSRFHARRSVDFEPEPSLVATAPEQRTHPPAARGARGGCAGATAASGLAHGTGRGDRARGRARRELLDHLAPVLGVGAVLRRALEGKFRQSPDD